jgi:hypothetical protein
LLHNIVGKREAYKTAALNRNLFTLCAGLAYAYEIPSLCIIHELFPMLPHKLAMGKFTQYLFVIGACTGSLF